VVIRERGRQEKDLMGKKIRSTGKSEPGRKKKEEGPPKTTRARKKGDQKGTPSKCIGLRKNDGVKQKEGHKGGLVGKNRTKEGKKKQRLEKRGGEAR